jgi:surface carbohydrate biosynthesis protein
MSAARPRVPLIIPVEGQVRELDAKLLLACVAARRGFPVVICRLKAVEARIASFPRSVYLAKGIAPEFIATFRILRWLGHEITGWDEEALVHFPPETHFARRMSPEASRYVSQLFAWGQENADLWRRYPHAGGTPIHVTGNPRADLLRPEMRPYFEDETLERRRAYGDFFLVNTNFAMLNSNRVLLLPVAEAGAAPALGPAAVGMTREFAERLERHKRDIFQRFQQMIPELERAFPGINVVIRPHPSENPEVYHRIAGVCERVHVVIDGNVVPWLLAAKATIHNGCTTAVEASLVGCPSISYGPTGGDARDFGRAFRLPDLLSHACPDFETLREALGRILAGELGCLGGAEREKLMCEFLTSQDGPLACEQIVDVLEECTRGRSELPPPPPIGRLAGWGRAHASRWGAASAKVAARAFSRKARRAPEARRAAYHDLSPEQVSERVDRFQRLLGDPVDLKIEKVARYIHRIHA